MGRFQNFDNQYVGVTWSVYFRDQVDTVQSKVSDIVVQIFITEFTIAS